MRYTSSKNKPKTVKRSVKEENTKQEKYIKSRLMLISLTHDNYVYKNKPISLQDANMYARELETFRNQSRDKRHLQVIDKLYSYMKSIQLEQSLGDIAGANEIDSICDSNQELIIANNNDAASLGHNLSAVVDLQMVRSLSNLSLKAKASKDLLAISDTNHDGGYQNKRAIDYIPSEVNKGNSNKASSLKALHINEVNKRNQSKVNFFNIIDQKPVKSKIKSTKLSKSKLNNYKQKNNSSKKFCRNCKSVKNKQSNPLLEHTLVKNNDYDNSNHKFKYSDIKVNPLKLTKLIEDSDQVSEDTDKTVRNNISCQIYQNNDCEMSGNNNEDIRNSVPNHSNENKAKACLLERNDMGIVDIKQPTDVLKMDNNNIQTLDGNNKNYNVAKKRYTLYNSCNTTDLQNLIPDAQFNTILNYYQTQENVEKHCTGKHDTHTKIYHDQHIFINKVHNTNDKGTSNKNLQHIETAKNIQSMDNSKSQNETNIIEKVKKSRKCVKRDINKSQKKRTYKRKNKVIPNVEFPVTPIDQYPIEEYPKTHISGNIVKNNQHAFIKKKKEIIDLPWVENLKYVRVIETEEYINYDQIEESFWNDFTIPSAMIDINDFEYQNINIWKK